MSDEQSLKKALSVYDSMCQTLDEFGWLYDTKRDTLEIISGSIGEDLHIPITIKIIPRNGLIFFHSPIPFVVPEDKRFVLASAVNMVNCLLVDGNLDYNISTGEISFRMTTCFLNSLVSKAVFVYLIQTACESIDVINDRLLALAEDKISLADFEKLFRNL